MVQVELGGVGNLSNNPGVVVLLLTPVDSLYRPYPDRHEPVFPVPIDYLTGQLYLSRLYQVLKGHFTSNEVLAGYCRALNISLDRVNIRLEDSSVKTSLEVTHAQGMKESLTVHLHRTVLGAVLGRIPIFVEATLLDRMAQRVRIQGRDTISGEPIDLNQIQVKELRQMIADGATPDHMTEVQAQFLQNQKSDVLEELLEVAVQVENFEWAACLQKMKRKNAE